MTGSSRRSFIKTLGSLPFISSAYGHSHLHRRVSDGVEAVLLGSAQDGGVPHAGCNREPCKSARVDAALRRRSPCLAVLDHISKEIFVFDAGPDFDEQMAMLPQGWSKGRNPFDALFLTHAHVGHYTGLQFLGRAIMSTQRLPVHGTVQMMDYIRNNGPWSLLVDIENIVTNTFIPSEKQRLNERISIKPILVPHRAEFTDCVAYLIQGPEKNILFLPDIDRWEEMETPIEEMLKDVDIALLDGTFYSPDELPGRDMSEIPHPPITETMARLEKAGTLKNTEVVFIHLNHSNPVLIHGSTEAEAVRKAGFQLGYDGKAFGL